jgi:two-component system LytT family response regulator
MTLAAMLVEDEPFARDDFCEIVAHFPEIELRWQVATLAEASEVLEQHSPDVIYLDVQLRDGNAFDLTGAIPEQTRIVFVTGFDSYAVRAFDVNALDFLLKPVAIGRFEQSLRRLLGTHPTEPPAAPVLNVSDRVLVKQGRRHDFVPLESVVAVICLGGNYTELCLNDGRRVETRRTVQQWERLLPTDCFVRVRRSTIINLHYVTSVRARPVGGLELQMQHLQKPVSVSRRLVGRVRVAFDPRRFVSQPSVQGVMASRAALSRAG